MAAPPPCAGGSVSLECGQWHGGRSKSLSTFVLFIPAWPRPLPEAGRVFIAGIFDVGVAFPRPCLIPSGSAGSMRPLLVFVLQAELPESVPAFPWCLQWIFL